MPATPPENPIDAINVTMEEAIAAAGSGAYDVAAKKAREAWMRIAGLPDSSIRDERLQWDREALAKIVSDLERRASSMPAAGQSGGHGSLIRPIEIQYVRG